MGIIYSIYIDWLWEITKILYIMWDYYNLELYAYTCKIIYQYSSCNLVKKKKYS